MIIDIWTNHMTFEAHFSIIKDPRKDINKQHELLDILFLVVCALLSNAEGFEDIEDFGEDKLEWLKQHRPFENGIPSHDTISRVIAGIHPDSLNHCFIEWINEMRDHQNLEVIAIDGKTLKRSYQNSKDKLSALHSVSAYAIEQGLTLIQKKSHAKKNEVQAVLDIIDELQLKGTIVTADAMSCLDKVTKKIVAKKADYVLQLKANQSKLLEEVQAYFHKIRRDNPALIEQGQYTQTDADHGRVETRQCTQLAVTDWFDHTHNWTKLNTVIEINRTRFNKTTQKQTTETAYYISSLEVNPKQANYAVRKHWAVENSLHYVLDVSFREDDSRIRHQYATENMAVLRRLALNLIKLADLNISIKKTLKKCAWNDDMRTLIITG